jgi:hypothetical protein
LEIGKTLTAKEGVEIAGDMVTIKNPSCHVGKRGAFG